MSLLVTGIARILNGIFAKYLSDKIRALNFGVGMVAMVLSIVAILYPNLTAQVLIYILSLVLLLNGVARLVIGGFARAFPNWLRGFFIVVGLSLQSVLAAVVFVSYRVWLTCSGSDAFIHFHVQWNSKNRPRHNWHKRKRRLALNNFGQSDKIANLIDPETAMSRVHFSLVYCMLLFFGVFFLCGQSI